MLKFTTIISKLLRRSASDEQRKNHTITQIDYYDFKLSAKYLLSNYRIFYSVYVTYLTNNNKDDRGFKITTRAYQYNK